MAVQFTIEGSTNKTSKFLKEMQRQDLFTDLHRLAEQGVYELAAATPYDSGTTANSWYYEIITHPDHVDIYWLNSNVNDGVNIAVIIQYGHGTRNGGYVPAVDYINPAIRPIFDAIREEVWRKVVNA